MLRSWAPSPLHAKKIHLQALATKLMRLKSENDKKTKMSATVGGRTRKGRLKAKFASTTIMFYSATTQRMNKASEFDAHVQFEVNV